MDAGTRKLVIIGALAETACPYFTAEFAITKWAASCAWPRPDTLQEPPR